MKLHTLYKHAWTDCVVSRHTPSIIDANGRHDSATSCKEGHDASNQAKLIVAFAEARAGQVIQRMQDAGELATPGNPPRSQDATSLLSDLDITKSDSSRFQLAAEVLESDEGWFDEHVVECNKARKDFTQQAVIRKGKAHNR